MASKSRAEINSEINLKVPTNGSEEISARDLREVLTSLNESAINTVDDNLSSLITNKADLINGKLDPAQLPAQALIDIFDSTQNSLQGYLDDEWSEGAIQRGDAVRFTTEAGNIEIWQMVNGIGELAGDYRKVFSSFSDLMFSNGLQSESGAVRLGGNLDQPTTFNLNSQDLGFVGTGAENLFIGTETNKLTQFMVRSTSVVLQSDNHAIDLSDAATISDNRAEGSRSGVEYADDYSEDFSDRSLVDKAYVLKQIMTVFGASDFQPDVVSIQNDITLDPGATPVEGVRYVITDPENLNANFGTIAGLEVNDIVEYRNGAFEIVLDASDAGEGILLFVQDLDVFYQYDGGGWSAARANAPGVIGDVQFSDGNGGFRNATTQFNYDDQGKSLIVGQGSTITGSEFSTIFGPGNTIDTEQPNSFYNFIHGQNNTIESGGWNSVLSEEGVITDVNGDRRSTNNNALVGGYQNRLEHTGGVSFGVYNVMMAAGQGNLVTGNAIASGFITGTSGELRSNYGFVAGFKGVASGHGSIVFGYDIDAGTGNFAQSAAQKVLADGRHAINMSGNTLAQTTGEGALGNYSAIVGGFDHHIPADSPQSVVLGGEAIKAPAATPNAVFMPRVFIGQGGNADLTAGASTDRIVVRDETTGELKLIDQGLFSAADSGWAKSGTTTLTDDVLIDNQLAGPFLLRFQVGTMETQADDVSISGVNNININRTTNGINYQLQLGDFTSQIGTAGLALRTEDGGGTIHEIVLTENGILEYSSDRSSVFTDRALVDKAYVDGQISTNAPTAGTGLTQSGSELSLDGNSISGAGLQWNGAGLDVILSEDQGFDASSGQIEIADFPSFFSAANDNGNVFGPGLEWSGAMLNVLVDQGQGFDVSDGELTIADFGGFFSSANDNSAVFGNGLEWNGSSIDVLASIDQGFDTSNGQIEISDFGTFFNAINDNGGIFGSALEWNGSSLEILSDADQGFGETGNGIGISDFSNFFGAANDNGGVFGDGLSWNGSQLELVADGDQGFDVSGGQIGITDFGNFFSSANDNGSVFGNGLEWDGSSLGLVVNADQGFDVSGGQIEISDFGSFFSSANDNGGVFGNGLLWDGSLLTLDVDGDQGFDLSGGQLQVSDFTSFFDAAFNNGSVFGNGFQWEGSQLDLLVNEEQGFDASGGQLEISSFNSLFNAANDESTFGNGIFWDGSTLSLEVNSNQGFDASGDQLQISDFSSFFDAAANGNIFGQGLVWGGSDLAIDADENSGLGFSGSRLTISNYGNFFQSAFNNSIFGNGFEWTGSNIDLALDSNQFDFNASQELIISNGGIKSDKLDLGDDPAAGQINAQSIPLSSEGSFSGTAGNIQEALEELQAAAGGGGSTQQTVKVIFESDFDNVRDVRFTGPIALDTPELYFGVTTLGYSTALDGASPTYINHADLATLQSWIDTNITAGTKWILRVISDASQQTQVDIKYTQA
ncbi:MAG: hypothetical protein AAFX87_24900 [Bacteroidota bacterium]